MTAHEQLRESKVVLNQGWVPVRLTNMFPDCTEDVCRYPAGARVYPGLVWLMRPGLGGRWEFLQILNPITCTWRGDGFP